MTITIRITTFPFYVQIHRYLYILSPTFCSVFIFNVTLSDTFNDTIVFTNILFTHSISVSIYLAIDQRKYRFTMG